jgi:hypothetical protein
MAATRPRHCCLLFALLLSGTAYASGARPVRAVIELANPFASYATSLTEDSLDRVGCRFILVDRGRIEQLRSRVINDVVALPGEPNTGFEVRTKLEFAFDDGTVEKLLLTRAYTNTDRLQATWNGVPAQVAHSLPSELIELVKALDLSQVNPKAHNARPFGTGNLSIPIEWDCLRP